MLRPSRFRMASVLILPEANMSGQQINQCWCQAIAASDPDHMVLVFMFTYIHTRTHACMYGVGWGAVCLEPVFVPR